MNKNNILVSVIILSMLLASTPMISYTVKADDPPFITIPNDQIFCNSKPIEKGDPEKFNVPIYNGENYPVSIDIRWYYIGLHQRPNEFNHVVPANANCNWSDNKTITWLGNKGQPQNITVELLLNSTGELLYSVDKDFTAPYFPWFQYSTYNTGEGSEQWAYNPSYMVDGMVASYASTTTPSDVELLVGSNCTGYETGNITEVYLRVKGYYSGYKHTITLRPLYNGELPGDDYEFDDITTSSSWSPWFDITEDRGAPETWNWYDIANLDCAVVADDTMSMFTLYCSQVEIRVCYT
jgi:hypothetical protein